MKTFKTATTALLLVLCFIFFFPIRSYASEIVPDSETEEDSDVPIISGMDATVRYCNNLNVRLTPSTSSEILATIPLGEHFTIIDQTGKWFEIDYNGISGYVFWKYVSFTETDISQEEDSNIIGNSIIQYTSSDNRDTNISIACNTINDIIFEPGEQFRWSDIVGQTTSDKGYLSAPVIVNRQSVSGLGGGVCQVSTTIYNALLDTSIVPDEIHKHSIGSSYAVNDATVAYGSKDFAFTNSYDFPIQIEAYSYKAVVIVSIYKLEEQ